MYTTVERAAIRTQAARARATSAWLQTSVVSAQRAARSVRAAVSQRRVTLADGAIPLADLAAWPDSPLWLRRWLADLGADTGAAGPAGPAADPGMVALASALDALEALLREARGHTPADVRAFEARLDAAVQRATAACTPNERQALTRALGVLGWLPRPAASRPDRFQPPLRA